MNRKHKKRYSLFRLHRFSEYSIGQRLAVELQHNVPKNDAGPGKPVGVPDKDRVGAGVITLDGEGYDIGALVKLTERAGQDRDAEPCVYRENDAFRAVVNADDPGRKALTGLSAGKEP